jgi:hypothetical protein
LYLPEPAPDGVIYVRTQQAADAMGVHKSTITRWRARGYLKPLDGCPPHMPMYAWEDVITAEYTARMAAITWSGTDIQVQRRG